MSGGKGHGEKRKDRRQLVRHGIFWEPVQESERLFEERKNSQEQAMLRRGRDEK